MSLDSPSPEIIHAIESAVEWFKTVKLSGIRLVTVADPQTPKGRDRFVVTDPDAPPIWGRFYSLETLKPMFVDRDGIPKDHLADIGYERRNGYAWYGNWPQRLIEKEHPEWMKRIEKRQ